jgi:hypothetical protein
MECVNYWGTRRLEFRQRARVGTIQIAPFDWRQTLQLPTAIIRQFPHDLQVRRRVQSARLFEEALTEGDLRVFGLFRVAADQQQEGGET